MQQALGFAFLLLVAFSLYFAVSRFIDVASFSRYLRREVKALRDDEDKTP